jgi:hypothetical protein
MKSTFIASGKTNIDTAAAIDKKQIEEERKNNECGDNKNITQSDETVTGTNKRDGKNSIVF